MDPYTAAIIGHVILAGFGVLNSRFKILDKIGLTPKDSPAPTPAPTPSPTIPPAGPDGEPSTPVLDLISTFTEDRPVINFFVKRIRDMRRKGIIDDRAAEQLIRERMAEETPKA